MKCVLVFFVLSSSHVLNTYSQSCVTPSGKNSECISLYECPPLLAAFDQKPLPREYLGFLRQSQCGFERYTPKVCCGPLPSRSGTHTTTMPSHPVWPSSDQGGQTSQEGQTSGAANEDSQPAQQCGEDNADRIYGGQITDLDEFPWMALLGYRTRNNTITYQCGGALINRRYVLSAAHCVTGSIEQAVGTLTTVRLGEYDTQQDIDCLDGVCAPKPQEIPVQRGYAHSGFSDKNTNRQDDIAIVRLARRAQYSDYVKPICLINTGASLDEGDTVYVAGWGKTLQGKNSPIKLKLSLPIFSKNNCLEKYRPLRTVLTQKQICAGGTFAQDTCRGDSGGPLMRRRPEGTWEIVGLVSFGNGCGMDGWPGVYTSVASYDGWIREKMSSTNV